MNRISTCAIFVESVLKGRGTAAAEICNPATAFFTRNPNGGRPTLVTAGHVVTGEDANTGQPLARTCARPDMLRLHLLGFDGNEQCYDVELYEPGCSWDDDHPRPTYSLHPGGPSVDVATLPVDLPTDACIEFVRLEGLVEADLVTEGSSPVEISTSMIPIPLRVTDRLFVVGFPMGDTGTWPAAIWTTGYIASEPASAYARQPALLIDARTRGGQSGSPVVRRITPNDSIWTSHGDIVFHEADLTELVGVYSGRTDERSDLGIVFTIKAIRETFTASQKV